MSRMFLAMSNNGTDEEKKKQIIGYDSENGRSEIPVHFRILCGILLLCVSLMTVSAFNFDRIFY